MENNLNDLKISGSGFSNGGTYNDVKISGSGEIKGDLKCNYLKISGSADICGNVEAKEIRSSGSCKIMGNLKVENIKISGSSHIRGGMVAETIEISGSCDIQGNIGTETIEISGSSDVKGSLSSKEVRISGASTIKDNCEADKFLARGAFDIGGLLNAENIKIYVGGKCRAREIGGTSIEVRYLSDNDGMFMKLFKTMFNGSYRRLETSIIEGDNIYLENTTASVVRGKNIEIGPNCNIDSVEYQQELKISQDSQVKEQKKVI